MIGQWVRMHFYDKLVHAKNSVYQALIWIRPGYEAKKQKQLATLVVQTTIGGGHAAHLQVTTI